MAPRKQPTEARKRQNREAQKRFREKKKAQRLGKSCNDLKALLAYHIRTEAEHEQGSRASLSGIVNTSRIDPSETSHLPEIPASAFVVSPSFRASSSTPEATLDPGLLDSTKSLQGDELIWSTQNPAEHPDDVFTTSNSPRYGSLGLEEQPDILYLRRKCEREHRVEMSRQRLEIEKLQRAGQLSKESMQKEKIKLEIERITILDAD